MINHSMLPSATSMLKAAGIVSLLLATPACQMESAAPAVLSWEAFKDMHTHTIDGRAIYVIEEDIAVSLEGLHDYYQRYVEHEAAEQGAGDTGDEIGRREQESIVNRVNGQDDIWRDNKQLRLTYCISNGFGSYHARAVTEMDQAARAWETVANVNFIYLKEENGNCVPTNANILIAVRPHSGSGALAFFPSTGANGNSLFMNFHDFDTNAFYANNSPNVTTVGVFRHELGHILGLRHEHTRPQAGGCFEDQNWRELTPYDNSSVMHYPWCSGGNRNSSLSLTNADVQGVQALYGAPGHLLAGGLYTIRSTFGCPDGTWCNAELSWDDSLLHPMASVEFNDHVDWELIPVAGRANRYKIRSTHGCPGGTWCNAELGWDNGLLHPMASVEFGDTVEWELVPTTAGPNRFKIISTYGCPQHQWCNAELAWDNGLLHPMASVEFGDTVIWQIFQ